MTGPPREPTPEECSAHAPLGDGWYAIWYPQMGGYSGKAAVKDHDCIDCYVWHDGEFPFGEGESPTFLHHCDTGQFRRFADDVDKIMEQRQ